MRITKMFLSAFCLLVALGHLIFAITLLIEKAPMWQPLVCFSMCGAQALLYWYGKGLCKD